jgi:hypothetical protein
MTVMDVSGCVGRLSSASGVIDEERVRRYSWQFYGTQRSVGVGREVWQITLTPQKKCLMKMMS